MNVAVVYRDNSAGLTRLAWTPIGNGGGDGGGGVAVNTATGNVFISNALDNTVSVISGNTNAVVATVPTGPNPFGAAVDPVTGWAFIVNRGGSDLTAIHDGFTP